MNRWRSLSLTEEEDKMIGVNDEIVTKLGVAFAFVFLVN